MPKFEDKLQSSPTCQNCSPNRKCEDCQKQRVRILQACKPCSVKKLKCDGTQPCHGCRKNPGSCFFEPLAKKRGPPKGYRQEHEALVNKVAQLEHLLHQYQQSSPDSGLRKTEIMLPQQYPSPTMHSISPTTPLDSAQSSPPAHHPASAVQENIGGTKYWGASSGFHMLPTTRQAMAISRMTANDEDENPLDEIVSSPPPISDDGADHLIRIYFTYTHRHFPLIFSRSTEDVRRTFSPLLLYAMYALAVRVSERPKADREEFGEQAFKYCCFLLMKESFSPSLQTCQALVLMSLRELACGKGSQGWLFGGMALRMATDLGLHRNVEFVRGQKMNQIELETRRRTFWNCYIVDTVASAFLGRPVSLKQGDFDTPFPDLFVPDEFDVWVDETEPTPRYKGNYAKRTYTITNFVSLAKLMRIINSILAEIYTLSQRRDQAPYAERVKILDDELNQWKADMPRELQIDNDLSPLPHVIVASMYYGLAKILLHRSNLFGDSTVSVEICRQESAWICSWIHKYSLLYGMRKIASGCMHALFAAALIQIYDLRDPTEDIANKARQRFEMCCQLLLSVAESWPLAKHLYHLLQDASQDRTGPPSRQSPEPAVPSSLAFDPSTTTSQADGLPLLDLEDVFSWEQLQALAPLGIPTDYSFS